MARAARGDGLVSPAQDDLVGDGAGAPLAQGGEHHEQAVPEWSKAVESAALVAARSSTRGSGWPPSGWASSWECQAAQSRQVRLDEAQEPSWDTAKEAL